MTKIDLTVAHRIVLAMACGVALLSVAVFIVLFQRDTLLDAAVQAGPLAAAALLSTYGATMARCLALR
jgi:hypothetical protein